MNWYTMAQTRKPVIYDPAQAGYKPEWGDHHGPVSYIPGLPYPHPTAPDHPMPLPKKLYHASPFASSIVQNGLKPRGMGRDKEAVFNGSGEEATSFTHLQNVVNYHKALEDMSLAAKGQLTKDHLDYIAARWSVKTKVLYDMYSKLEQEYQPTGMPESEKQRKIMVQLLHDLDGLTPEQTTNGKRSRFPWIIGNARGLTPKFEKMNHEDIGIIEANLEHPRTNINHGDEHNKGGQPVYSFYPGEQEWRVFDSSSIPKHRIRRLDPSEFEQYV